MRSISRMAAAVATAALGAAALLAVNPSHAATSGRSLGAPPPEMIAAASRAPAPDFSRSLLGAHGSSGPEAFTGRVLVIAFWSSWCAPCRSELRRLQAASRQAPAVAFLGVDIDDSPAPALATLDRAGISFPNVSDPGSGVAEAFGVAGTPTIVVVDPHGRIAATAVGPMATAPLLRLIREVAP